VVAMNKKIKILFVQSEDDSFIQRDLDLLKRHYDVRKLEFNLFSIKEDLKLLQGILWADMTFSWFAGYHAFCAVKLSRLLGKRSIVVVGGYEVVNLPEIHYGGLVNYKNAKKIKYTIENANAIISVSEFNREEILNFAHPKKLQLIYNAVDSTLFKPEGAKEKLVLTVGEVKQSNLKRKGLECFVETASFLPDIEFVLIGPRIDNSIDFLKSIAPPNIKFLNNVSDKELINWYRRAKVYCQLSLHEAFGVALAEAMLCECVPVVTCNAAIPELVGTSGFYALYSNPKSAADAIRKALQSSKGPEARIEILNKFSPSKREKELVYLIDSIF
jgi:glycosyltransferase involved in cell wall biosynthesis